jgi:hypothetical protein
MERYSSFMGFPLHNIHDPQRKGLLPPSLHERDAPFPETYFICLSKSPVNDPPSRFPNEAF